MAETINDLAEAEVIHRRGPWRSHEVVEHATLGCVDRPNNHRLLDHVGSIAPADTEATSTSDLKMNPWPRDQRKSASDKPGALTSLERSSRKVGQSGSIP